jgi:hypothetical protein
MVYYITYSSSIVISNSYNLSLDEWKEIRNYCDKYNIRLVVLNSEPSLLGGLIYSKHYSSYTFMNILVNYIEINGDQEKTMLSFTPQAKEKGINIFKYKFCKNLNFFNIF